MTRRQQVLLTDKGTLQRDWPYTRARFEQRLADTADITFTDVQETDLSTLDWESFDAVALLGGELDATILARAPRLAVVGEAYAALHHRLELPRRELGVELLAVADADAVRDVAERCLAEFGQPVVVVTPERGFVM